MWSAWKSFFKSCIEKLEWDVELSVSKATEWETLVRSVKKLLKKDLRNYKITFEELQAILLEVELIINNCLLTHIYIDSTDLPLTPSQLVFSRYLNHSSLSESLVNVEIDIEKNRYKYRDFYWLILSIISGTVGVPIMWLMYASIRS